MAMPFGVGTELNSNTLTTSFGDVPNSCGETIQQVGGDYEIPMFGKSCVLAILRASPGTYWDNIDETYILQMGDDANFYQYYKEHHPELTRFGFLDDPLTSDVARIYDANLKGKKISDLSEDFSGPDVKTPAEQIKDSADSIGGAFGFITDSANIVRMLAIVLGIVLIAHSAGKLTQ